MEELIDKLAISEEQRFVLRAINAKFDTMSNSLKRIEDKVDKIAPCINDIESLKEFRKAITTWGLSILGSIIVAGILILAGLFKHT